MLCSTVLCCAVLCCWCEGVGEAPGLVSVGVSVAMSGRYQADADKKPGKHSGKKSDKMSAAAAAGDEEEEVGDFAVYTGGAMFLLDEGMVRVGGEGGTGSRQMRTGGNGGGCMCVLDEGMVRGSGEKGGRTRQMKMAGVGGGMCVLDEGMVRGSGARGEAPGTHSGHFSPRHQSQFLVPRGVQGHEDRRGWGVGTPPQADAGNNPAAEDGGGGRGRETWRCTHMHMWVACVLGGGGEGCGGGGGGWGVSRGPRGGRGRETWRCTHVHIMCMCARCGWSVCLGGGVCVCGGGGVSRQLVLCGGGGALQGNCKLEAKRGKHLAISYVHAGNTTCSRLQLLL
jgi:hypothetical protein